MSTLPPKEEIAIYVKLSPVQVAAPLIRNIYIIYIIYDSYIIYYVLTFAEEEMAIYLKLSPVQVTAPLYCRVPGEGSFL